MKSITSCRAGNCTNFAGFLCRKCGRMMCRQHYNVSKGLCLACAAPEEGGCSVVGVLVGIAVLIGIVILIVPKNTGQPSSAPIHIEQSATSAERNGNTSVITYQNQQGVQLAIGGSVTFHVNIPIAGLYYLCASGDTTRIDITPTSEGSTNIVYDVIVNGKLHDQVDTHDAYWYGIGSNSPNSCINDSPIQLNSGANTIQIKLDEKTQCGTFACPGLFVQSISLDPK